MDSTIARHGKQSPSDLSEGIRNGTIKPVDIFPTVTTSHSENPVTLQIDQINVTGDTQPRDTLDENVVEEYADGYRAGVEFPAIVVFYDGTTYWLVDGFHRYRAAVVVELPCLTCKVHEGTLQEAQWYSYSANQTHGLRRSNADKARAVRAALKHPNGTALSDRQIADHVGVSHTFVSSTRHQLSTVDSSLPRIGKDGRKRRPPKRRPPKQSPKTDNSSDPCPGRSECGSAETDTVAPRKNEGKGMSLAHEAIIPTDEAIEDQAAANLFPTSDEEGFQALPQDDRVKSKAAHAVSERRVLVDPADWTDDMKTDLRDIEAAFARASVKAEKLTGAQSELPPDDPIIASLKSLQDVIVDLSRTIMKSGILDEGTEVGTDI